MNTNRDKLGAKGTEVTIECCTSCLHDGFTKSVIVSECLPIRAFGNHSAACVKVVTMGLNPALNEFCPRGRQWKSKELRLPIVADYDKYDRAGLREDDTKKALARRENYFCDPKRNSHPFFKPLSVLLRDVNSAWSYKAGSAVHCDLVACATTVAWSYLSARIASKLAENCRKHFLNTLSEIPSSARLLLNGAFVFGELCRQGLYMKLERGPEPIYDKPLLIGWRGKIVLRSGGQWLFCAWSRPVACLKPQQRMLLASWLQRHCC
jgi:hypothetical protein